MDFAKILDEWEKKGEAKRRKHPMEDLGDSDLFWDAFDKGESDVRPDKAELRRRLREMDPQEEVDLHGYTVREARIVLDRFFREAARRGLKKVLIIHGKGKHSRDLPVLSRFVMQYLEESSAAGESGPAKKNMGGSGATWVILKGSDQRSR